MSRLSRLIALPRERRKLLWACGMAVLRASWQVRTWPFARLTAGLGTPLAPAIAASDWARITDQADLPLARDVRWAVAAWSRTLPWPPTCLMQALAARSVLVARSVSCELFFGVQAPKAGGSGPRPQAIGAHAWLRCGGLTVTGEAEAAAFQPIAVYRWAPA